MLCALSRHLTPAGVYNLHSSTFYSGMAVVHLRGLRTHLAACRNDSQVNNRKVVLLSEQGDAAQQQEVCWKDVVAGDLVKVNKQ